MVVVIPALGKHKPVVVELVRRLLRSGGQSSSIIIVTPDVVEYSEDAYLGRCRVVAEAAIERISKFDLASMLGGRSGRVGWYYQQLLKYAAVERFCSEGDVLICDADTVIVGDVVELFAGFPSSKEWNPGYFVGFNRLTGLRPVLSKSAIVNFMLFRAEYMQSLLRCIEYRSGKSWVNAIIDLLCGDGEFEFSEYEVYANWEAATGGRNISVPFKMFRRADLLLSNSRKISEVVVSCSNAGYQAVAFEFEHRRSPAKKLMANIVLLTGVNFW